MSTNPAPLQYGITYHVYNQGINHESIFREADNYRYFLEQYIFHVGWLVDTYAYCLLGNHFHFLVRVKDRPYIDDLIGHRATTPDVDHIGPDPAQPPSQHFSNLFNAYARAFNIRYHRSGSLFKRPFGRIPVTTHRYFAYLVVYIHQNPQKHGFVNDYRDWPYSSYHALCGERPTRLDRAGVLDWLGGANAFAYAHIQDLTAHNDVSGL